MSSSGARLSACTQERKREELNRLVVELLILGDIVEIRLRKEPNVGK